MLTSDCARSQRQRAYKDAMEYLRLMVKKNEPDAVILSAVKGVDQAHKDMVATNIANSKK